MWPPDAQTTEGTVGERAQRRLSEAGLGELTEVTVTFKGSWCVEVVLPTPAPGLVDAIAAVLAPVQTDVVWFEGSFETLPSKQQQAPTATTCGVCGGRNARQEYSCATPAADPRQPFALVGRLFLCDFCGDLLAQEAPAALAERFAARHGSEPDPLEVMVVLVACARRL